MEFKHDQLFTPMEVAEILNVSRAWVYAQIKCGKIMAVRLSARNVRISGAEIQRKIETGIGNVN